MGDSRALPEHAGYQQPAVWVGSTTGRGGGRGGDSSLGWVHHESWWRWGWGLISCSPRRNPVYLILISRILLDSSLRSGCVLVFWVALLPTSRLPPLHGAPRSFSFSRRTARSATPLNPRRKTAHVTQGSGEEGRQKEHLKTTRPTQTRRMRATAKGQEVKKIQQRPGRCPNSRAIRGSPEAKEQVAQKTCKRST